MWRRPSAARRAELFCGMFPGEGHEGAGLSFDLDIHGGD